VTARATAPMTEAPGRLGRFDRHWTAAEDGRLRMLWGEASVSEIAKRMDRTQVAIYWRAGKLGLPRGLQPGMEYMRQAATRTGFDAITLEGLLRWAGVDIVRTMSRPIRGAAHRMRAVDTVDVDDAIERWMACEIVNHAARRHGLNFDMLARWLEESGEEMPQRPRGKRWWRVPTDVIDRVVAKRRGVETIMQAARRVGVSRDLLSRLLKAAGVPRGTAHYWRVSPADVDRVVAAMTPRQWSFVRRNQKHGGPCPSP